MRVRLANMAANASFSTRVVMDILARNGANNIDLSKLSWTSSLWRTATVTTWAA